MAVSLDEIRQLQQELDRAQRTAVAAKLSKRNCVQIVMKLQEQGLIELLYTIDGKEYLTPAQLRREISDEIVVHNGRLNIVDLVELLNVDMTRIEKAVEEVMADDPHLHLILGELITDVALDNIAAEVNELVQEAGIVDISELSSRFTLPSEFLLTHLKSRMGMLVQGTLDETGRRIVTEAYVARKRAIVRGYFSAVTRATDVSQVVEELHIDSKLIMETLTSLLKEGRLQGELPARGGQYTPAVHTRTQDKWVSSFFQSNQYIEYHKLAQLGISNPKKYLKEHYPKAIALASCVVADTLIGVVNSYIDEALGANGAGFLDVLPLLPAPCTEDDVAVILKLCKAYTSSTDIVVVRDSILLAPSLIDKLKEHFRPMMTEKAKQLPPSALLELQGKDKGKAAASSAATASNSKKGKDKRKGKGDPQFPDDDEDAPAKGGKASGGGGGKKAAEEAKSSFQFLTAKEIEREILKAVPDIAEIEDLAKELAEMLHRPLAAEYIEVAKATLQAGGEQVDRRQQREALEKEINAIINHMAMFEKGLEHFDDATQAIMVKHLNTTLGTDAANVLTKLHALDAFLELNYQALLTNEQRKEVLAQLPSQQKQKMADLYQLLTSSKSAADVIERLQTAAEDAQVFIRRADKRAERELRAEHKQALLAKLRTERDPALVLHLVTAVLFLEKHAAAIHFPGRCVPAVIKDLAKDLTEAHAATLLEAQTRVTEALRAAAAANAQHQDQGADDAPASPVVPPTPPPIDLSQLRALVLKEEPAEP